MNNGNNGQETHSTKMGADSLAKNTTKAPEFICPICLPKPKSYGLQRKKASLGVHSPWFKQTHSVHNGLKYLWSKSIRTMMLQCIHENGIQLFTFLVSTFTFKHLNTYIFQTKIKTHRLLSDHWSCGNGSLWNTLNEQTWIITII